MARIFRTLHWMYADESTVIATGAIVEEAPGAAPAGYIHVRCKPKDGDAREVNLPASYLKEIKFGEVAREFELNADLPQKIQKYRASQDTDSLISASGKIAALSEEAFYIRKVYLFLTDSTRQKLTPVQLIEDEDLLDTCVNKFENNLKAVRELNQFLAGFIAKRTR